MSAKQLWTLTPGVATVKYSLGVPIKWLMWKHDLQKNKTDITETKGLILISNKTFLSTNYLCQY